MVLWRFFDGSLMVHCGFFKGSLKFFWGSVEFLGSFGRVFTLGFLVLFLVESCL